MAKKISELSIATHSSVTPQARILVNEVNASSSTGYTTKQMSIDELNQELMENYHYLTSNDLSSISGGSSSQSPNTNPRYIYLDDGNLEEWQKICPIVFYDPQYEALFVIDKDSAKRYIDYNNQILSGPDSDGFNTSTDYNYNDSSNTANRVELFDYNDDFTYVDNNASSGC